LLLMVARFRIPGGEVITQRNISYLQTDLVCYSVSSFALGKRERK
jgi:hypothetical protein